MKKAAAVLLAMLLLTGCSVRNAEMERCLKLRTKLLAGSGCTFDAAITADYGDKLQTFSLGCRADEAGTISFSVTKPESISGISGTVDGKDGTLTFDETVLYFPLLADDQIVPVCAPWLFLKTLRSGYIAAAGKDGNLLRMSIDDSYDDDALRLEIWMDETDTPIRAEAVYLDRRILSLDVGNFRIE